MLKVRARRYELHQARLPRLGGARSAARLAPRAPRPRSVERGARSRATAPQVRRAFLEDLCVFTGANFITSDLGRTPAKATLADLSGGSSERSRRRTRRPSFGFDDRSDAVAVARDELLRFPARRLAGAAATVRAPGVCPAQQPPEVCHEPRTRRGTAPGAAAGSGWDVWAMPAGRPGEWGAVRRALPLPPRSGG